MCLHPAVPQIFGLSGVEGSLWTDEYADGQFLDGSNCMDCPVSQVLDTESLASFEPGW